MYTTLYVCMYVFSLCGIINIQLLFLVGLDGEGVEQCVCSTPSP